MLIATESLTRLDKLHLIEQFWDELSRGSEEVESPRWHAEASAQSELAVAGGEAVFIDWNPASGETQPAPGWIRVKLRILSLAVHDLEVGRDFYERQQSGLGDYFLDTLFSDIEALLIHGGFMPAISATSGACPGASLRDLIQYQPG